MELLPLFYQVTFFTEESSSSIEVVREHHETFANITLFRMIVASILRVFLVYKGKAESKAGLGDFNTVSFLFFQLKQYDPERGYGYYDARHNTGIE
ncbi:MAG: hypothetical protein WC780_04485 [Lentimicrobiaceae bacterium]